MEIKSGFEIVRVKDISWEDRRDVDNWPSRAGMYCDDKDNQLCIRLIDYPRARPSRAMFMAACTQPRC